MFISFRKFSPDLPLDGANSLHSVIDSIEKLGSELVTLTGHPPEGAGPGFNLAYFKRRAIGDVPPALELEDDPVPAPNQDVEVDAAGKHAGQTLLGTGHVWVQGGLRIVTAWRRGA